MAQLAICGLLFGAVFGLRFKVLILVPVTLVSAVVITAVTVAEQQSAAQALLAMLVAALTLQAGYVFGSISRFTMAAARGEPLLGSQRQERRVDQKRA
jgi:hypothetical protein